MYLHLGQGVVVPYRDVLALFDLDNTSASHLTRRFLERAEQAGQVVNVAEDLPKSFVLCRPAGLAEFESVTTPRASISWICFTRFIYEKSPRFASFPN